MAQEGDGGSIRAHEDASLFHPVRCMCHAGFMATRTLGAGICQWTLYTFAADLAAIGLSVRNLAVASQMGAAGLGGLVHD
jgi:hypothetical protein